MSNDTIDLSEHQVPSGAVVVGVDGSTGGERALLWAIDQAQREHRPMVLVHALSPAAVSTWMSEPGFNQAMVLDAFRDSGHAVLEEARRMVVERAPELVLQTVYVEHDPRDTLLEFGRHAAMIVLGSRGRGAMTSMVLGSVSLGVALHASCPVVVLRPGAHISAGDSQYGVVVGVDGSERSSSALEFGYRQASLRGLPLTVLHVHWELDARTADELALILAESVAGMAEKFPDVQATVRHERGIPGDALVSVSQNADLVVVGSHPGNGLHDLLTGETSRELLGRAKGAIAVVSDRV